MRKLLDAFAAGVAAGCAHGTAGLCMARRFVASVNASMARRFVASAVVGACACLSADTLLWDPVSSTTTTNRYGHYIYCAENWRDSQGVARAPANGDVLLIRKNIGLTASGTVEKEPVSGMIFDGVRPSVNQGTFHMNSGGVGLSLTNVEAAASWYCAINVYGSDELPVYVCKNGTISFQRYFMQADGGVATVVKQGPGTLQFFDNSKYAQGNRATWKRTRLEGGTFLWCIYGSDGTSTDLQVFPNNHQFTFADAGGGVTFSIYDRDCEMKNFELREASPLANPSHVITSRGTTNVYLRLNGEPPVNPMGFGGRMEGTAGVIWNPSDSQSVFVFSNSVSTTKGGLIVSNGTVRVEGGATFTQLSRVLLAPGASLVIGDDAVAGFYTKALDLADGTASLTIGNGAFMCDGATVGGAPIAGGVYTAADFPWLNGDGFLCVDAGGIAASNEWWERETGPTELAAGTMTNWHGMRFEGAEISLTAESPSIAMIGAGGVDVASNVGATNRIGWATYLNAAQQWRIGTNTAVELSGVVDTVGGCKWTVLGGGALMLTGLKQFNGDMTVTNATLIATGDDSLGGEAGKTTFEIADTANKGVLMIRPEPGKTEVSFRRKIVFHYARDGEHGNFMYLPADTTVNFYGMMETSVAAPHSGPGYPNHWNYSCPATTVVHWHGGMKASLNHKFPGGTHYIHKALTGGDRFHVLSGAVVELLAGNNSIGGASGVVKEKAKICTRVPYAIDARNANRVLTFTGEATLDLCGNDQALSVLQGYSTEARKACVTSAVPATLRITRNQLIDNSVNATCTNYVRWVGKAGLSVERMGDHPVVLMSESPSEGELRVASGFLVLHAPGGKWPNASVAEVAGGKMTVEHGEALGTNTLVRFTGGGAFGKMELFPGVRQRVGALEIDGVEQPAGYYGSSASSARNVRDDLFEGLGVLRVGEPRGLAFLIR